MANSGIIMIGYKNKHFYQDFFITRFRDLDDVRRDFKRLIQTLKPEKLAPIAGLSVYALGVIDDDTGALTGYPKPEFIIDIPVPVFEGENDE